MKQIINGKTYNTETAECVASYYSRIGDRLYNLTEYLYKKKDGEMFLEGEGGPMTEYAVQIDSNNWSGSTRLIPLSANEAKDWVEKHCSADVYIQLFGEPEE